MRIVLVYQHFSAGGPGSSKPYDLARHLIGCGHDVTVVCGQSFLGANRELPKGLVKRLEIDGIKIRCIGVQYKQGMSFTRRLWSFFAFTFMTMWAVAWMPRYDVLVASSTPLTIGLVGLVSSHIRRRPWVFEIRDFWPESTYANGYLKSKTLFQIATFFEEWFYRDSKATCAIATRMIDRLVERGFPREKLHFIPTGVDMGIYNGPPDDSFRKQHGLEGQFVAIYAGAHGKVNGLGYVLEAAEYLRGEPRARIVLLGDGTEKARLEEEAKKRNLCPHPLLFLPPVGKNQIPGILKSCDVMLMVNADRPGMKDLMTNKFFDYLACAKPIMVNLQCELTNWILRHECGLMTAPDKPVELAEAIKSLRADPARCAEMGRRGRLLAQQEFDRAKLHQRWEAVLQAAAEPAAEAAPEKA